MTDQTLKKIIRSLANEAGEKELLEVSSWRDKNPEEFKKIKLIYQNTPFDQKDFDSLKIKEVLAERINVEQGPVLKSKSYGITYWLKIAAVFLIMATIGPTLYFYNKSLSYENTNLTSQVIEINLPDGSLVSLDKNSTLTYKRSWLNKFNREVELSGRAYFQIKRDVSHSFLVKTTNTKVEVLGTKFTVSNNFGKMQVILNEGKIRVGSDKTNESYLLTNQGEQLIITCDGTVKQGVINKNLYFSWLDDKLNFDNCKVSETLGFLSDSYNLKFEMKDRDALDKHLFGSAPSDNPKLIIEAIAKITDTRIKEIDQTIIFE
jgi:ferric-dicitrate binding protein FerR (iron transport regulator)